MWKKPAIQQVQKYIYIQLTHHTSFKIVLASHNPFPSTLLTDLTQPDNPFNIDVCVDSNSKINLPLTLYSCTAFWLPKTRSG